MARARLLNPEFFMDEDLAAMPLATRYLFAGLWCLADREGRMADRPLRIKAETFTYENMDVEPLLEQLYQAGLIERYEVAGRGYINVVNFLKYQRPHEREAKSSLPGPAEGTSRPAQGEPCVAEGKESLPVTVIDPVTVPEIDPVSDAVGDAPRRKRRAPTSPPESLASVLEDQGFLDADRAA